MVHVGDDWYSDFISPSKIGITSFYLDRTGKKSGEFVLRDLNELNDRLTFFSEI
jgi:predicted HAD superfamily hydrolase